ncbi:hypothetical protein EDB92DRAFT_1842721 [Lactarius akahatsu]|uniref:Uncharacterized protein n=1 Tax=Lactarius akahatsu TaxID=416441 RepID=A0AAD4LR64_9AGAM|nr:hypothetical protein EDB92DRAFT_1842721 [Lactarius akahatsu]
MHAVHVHGSPLCPSPSTSVLPETSRLGYAVAQATLPRSETRGDPWEWKTWRSVLMVSRSDLTFALHVKDVPPPAPPLSQPAPTTHLCTRPAEHLAHSAHRARGATGASMGARRCACRRGSRTCRSRYCPALSANSVAFSEKVIWGAGVGMVAVAIAGVQGVVGRRPG